MTVTGTRPAPAPVRHPHRRRWMVGTLTGVAVTLLAIVGGPWVYATFVRPEAPAPLALAAPTDLPEPEAPAGPLVVDGSWQVGPGSEAGYRLGEVLSGKPVTVVGRTGDVSGSLEVSEGLLTAATVVVDTASISTDESARDAYFRRAVGTTDHPTATFTLTSPVDVSALRDGGPLELELAGDLAFHGVSRPVVASLEVRREGEGVEAVGTVPVTLEDYDLDAPDLGFVTVEPAGTVEMRLLLTR